MDHMSSAEIPSKPPQPQSDSRIVCGTAPAPAPARALPLRTAVPSLIRVRVDPVMVGLPARGKSYIGQKVSRYLNWMGVVTKVFNVGQYRRQFYGNHHSHEWFAPDNAASQQLRQHAAQCAADDMLRHAPRKTRSRRCTGTDRRPRLVQLAAVVRAGGHL
jgi:hypothetical protein